ncbi:hypothetical protein [Xylophilus sp.]|uniref:hypothetical protein n=1 Tax=Xylophilus sp. TaxID=2653893 RepID=UPI0013B6B874|nr:hypothetical protein [Xylophilus sp.]KAF1049329.1 MAG: hypothetical protein GAK38_00785 [Xylophilus sp.]
MNLRPATIDDCWTLADSLRSKDLQELSLVADGASPLDKALRAWAGSEVCEAFETDAGQLVCVWGVQRFPGRLGSIWMLGTPRIEEVPLSFLRACRPVIARASAGFDVLGCAPWRENALHLRWLSWLGFTPRDTGHPVFLPHYLHV